MDPKFEQLQKFYQSFIPDISQQELRFVSSLHEIKSFKKGEELLSPGMDCSWVGFVNLGILRVFHSVEGKEFINQFYFPGSIATEITSFNTMNPTRMYIDVVKDCEIAELSRAGLAKMQTEFPKVMNMVSAYTTKVLIGYLDRYSSLLLDSAETRYLKLLKERPELIQQVPLYMVASYLGITPEALSRVRNKIAQTGA